MSRNVYQEAELILASFPNFYAVDENINHLYGVVQKTGVKQFTVEIIFPQGFPDEPPRFKISKEIADLLGNNISLKTLENWQGGRSHVVDVLKELKLQIDKHLEDDFLDLRPSPAPTTKAAQARDYAEFSTPEPFMFHGEEDGNLGIKPVARPAADYENKPVIKIEGELQDGPVVPEDKQWTENMFVPGDDSQADSTDQWEPLEPTIVEPEIGGFTGDPEKDARLKEELDMLMMEYSFDYNSSMADVNVYLTISIESTFIIRIDFGDYPGRPRVDFPDTLKSLVPDPYTSLETLRSWDPSSPPHVVEIVRELESRLWTLNDIEARLKKIFGEFEASYLPGSKTAVKVTILTYGFQEYQVTIDLKDFPARPVITYGPELSSLLRVPPEQLKVVQAWDESEEKEAVAIVREINWLVDKESRMNFEINLLKGSLKEVEYDATARTILATMKGTMKTQERLFKFKAILPENYPLAPPAVELLSELDDEAMEKKMNASLKTLLAKWMPSSSYLVDAFNAISKAIFEVSVITCIICHQFNCPSCAEPLDSPDMSEPTCKVVCPYCERSYHKHCWDQTIATFGKCGFCLRPPPPNMMP